ncbi:uncharacterized protein LOC111262136 isoform X4 [Varroa jacobsoni]|uniref:Uncharacterized protein n=1 Tax=Varroa destructor TaxID=109461 RepID=A0A7M7M9R7_VARDE|nr:uncharacterized protein LOC111250007 isoform X5 [Varroa destructor]XP_022691906.1 uncharacterized protein LOC111262136 isoform X4 [Varroa jacobsoni]XP_022691907.1 uncharacterized protein LOC111262136 isoform X4 [Varroa jacobsoni]
MTYTPVFYALYPNGRPGAQRRSTKYEHLQGDQVIEVKCGPVVTGGTEERAPSRVRVHFFESGAVKCPSATGGSSAAMDVSVDGQLFNGNASNSYFRETQQTQQHVFTTSTPNGTSVRTVTYTARQSTDSGIDNPFRPEGELSLEADEIVKAIKEGRPIDSIDSGRISRQELGTTTLSINTSAVPENKSPTNVKNGAAKNGSAKGPSNKKDAKPGVVDVQRGVVVPPSEAQQAEQVVIKKKPRCKCCVIQ